MSILSFSLMSFREDDDCAHAIACISSRCAQCYVNVDVLLSSHSRLGMWLCFSRG
jgi:hypothetical protein